MIEIPNNVKIIEGRFIFSNEIKTDGKSLAKARWVTRVFRRNYEDKLTNTLDPMSRISSLRCTIQIVAQYGCITHQSGATTGCLNADLGHNILIGQSHRIARNGSNTVCYLRKSLYGLKQGAKPWNDTIHGSLVSWVYHIIL